MTDIKEKQRKYFEEKCGYEQKINKIKEQGAAKLKELKKKVIVLKEEKIALQVKTLIFYSE